MRAHNYSLRQIQQFLNGYGLNLRYEGWDKDKRYCRVARRWVDAGEKSREKFMRCCTEEKVARTREAIDFLEKAHHKDPLQRAMDGLMLKSTVAGCGVPCGARPSCENTRRTSLGLAS